MPTTRERWYALHRARRTFKRDSEKNAREILALPQARPVDRHRAATMLIYPPLIVDHSLPHGGVNIYQPRGRLP